jgi:hypothetical protein
VAESVIRFEMRTAARLARLFAFFTPQRRQDAIFAWCANIIQ